MSFQIPIADKTLVSDKYQRIIAAAIKVFAEKGFFKAKVADVAREADVADGTIYLYFKNKDDLLISIFEHSMDFFLSEAKEEIEPLTSPAKKLKKFIQRHLMLIEKNQNLAAVLQVELRSSAKFMKEYEPKKFFSYLDFLETIIVDGQRRGVFKKDVNYHIAKRSIFGAIDELALEWILTTNKRYTLDEAARQLYDMILAGIKEKST